MSATSLEHTSEAARTRCCAMYPVGSVPADDPAAETYIVGVLVAAGSWLDLPEPVRAQAAVAARPGASAELRAQVLWQAVAAGLDLLPLGEVRRLVDAGLLAQELGAR